MNEETASASADSFDTRGLRRVWFLSLAVSAGTVAGLFVYANLVNWHGGVPLGYDSYYYVGWINQVVSFGPLQFAASQHYIEFLYPIVASIPVYLGASADSVEIILPIVLVCLTIVATGVLALESMDWRFAILTVAFTGAWSAIFAMVADFNANLFAFPLLLLATALLVRVARRGKASTPFLGVFVLLVVLAGAAHIETTDFFIAAWVLAFIVLRWKASSSSWRWSSLMIVAGAVAASPLTIAYLQGISGGFGAQPCVSLIWWLQVFGPAGGLAVLGIGVAAVRYRAPAIEGYFARLLLVWSALAIAIGVLGYISRFPIVLSERSLLLLPLPFVSSLGGLWLAGHFQKVPGLSQTRLLTILALAIPLLTAPAVFSYVSPAFRYFAEHGPSLVGCAAS